jgi:hypothetical protein
MTVDELFEGQYSHRCRHINLTGSEDWLHNHIMFTRIAPDDISIGRILDKLYTAKITEEQLQDFLDFKVTLRQLWEQATNARTYSNSEYNEFELNTGMIDRLITSVPKPDRWK